MRKIGVLNDFSTEYLEKFRLPAKKVVEYQLLNGRKNDDPEKAKDQPLRYPTTVFSLKGVAGGILDPGKNNYVEYGILRTYSVSGGELANPVWEKLTVNAPDGVFALVGGRDNADDIYFVLEHHPENEATPQYEGYEKKFRRVNKQADAKVQAAKTNVLREALNFIAAMSQDEIREFAAAQSWNENEDIEILVAQMNQSAISDPVKFLNRMNDESTALAALIRRGLAQNIIGFDPITNKYTWADGEVLAQLERADGKQPEEMLINYFVTGSKEAEIKLKQLRKAFVSDKAEKVVEKPKK